MAPRKNVGKDTNDVEAVPTANPRVLRPKVEKVVVYAEDSPPSKKTTKVTKNKKEAKEPAPAKPKAAAKPKKVAAKGHKLPDPIAPGQIFIDSVKKEWKVGKSLGTGGFGEVYSATDDMNEKQIDNYKYVMKVEYSTGPLFVEQHFYLRCAKQEHIETWMKEKKVKCLGLPTFYGMKGQQEHNGNSYRFIIITKFGPDLQKLLEEHKQFSLKNIVSIACSLLDTLEYIHYSGYVHADLKPANILLGINSSHAIVNIVDFGLATKYKDVDNNHKPHVSEKKSAHNGTLMYTSILAHRGVVTTSRMCDIEILAYNLLHMCTGTLPWLSLEKEPLKVLSMKEELLKEPAKFFNTYYKDNPVNDVFIDVFKYLSSNLTSFETVPDYSKLKQLFIKALQKSGLKYDGKLDFKDSESTKVVVEKPKRGNAKKKNALSKVVKVDEVNSDSADEERKFKNINVRRKRVNDVKEDEQNDEDETPDLNEEPEVSPETAKAIVVNRRKKLKNENETTTEEEIIENKTKATNGRKKLVKQAEVDIEEEVKEVVEKDTRKRKAEDPKTPEELHNLNETYVIPKETYDNPTPAMLEIMNKRNEKQAQKRAPKKK